MIRVIASAAVVGALIAGGSVYAGHEPAWRSRIAGWSGSPETRLATEAWPICTTMTAMGTESDWAQLDPDFAAGKRALVAEDWNGAIVALELAVLRDPRNADIQNYIGYAYRRLRQLGPAMGHYQQALMFNPRHRGAREHLGELYLVLGEPIKAEEQLAALKEICLILCDELTDLERAITAYTSAAQRQRAVALTTR
jgi:tetratricopeptide (TPR) repeat protein